jgi:hypothetical protein
MKTNDRLEEHKESLLEDERDLSNIFQLGIVRTLWKSHILNKINELRVALNLEPRTEALPEATYDQEVADQLSQIDFSPLGHSHNAQKGLVLTFAGIGLTPVLQDDTSALLGDEV